MTATDRMIVARWRTRLVIRKRLLARARRQLAYWETQRKRADRNTERYVKASQMVTDRQARVALRAGQVAYAQRVIARHQSKQPTEPPCRTVLSPNRSARNVEIPTLIVLHATEGSAQSAIGWLTSRESMASAHLVVSRTGETTRLVPDSEKAWHAVAVNSFSLGIEQEGRSAQTEWPDAQLETVARWVAYWSAKYNIPIRYSTTAGVCRHSDLGEAGGNHGDPGSNYPFDRVLKRALELRG